MAETILVTGATGTVGSEVVKQLLSARGGEEDIIVKAAARSANDSTFRNLRVQIVQLDYNKPDTLSSALRGIDKLFLLTPFQSNMVDLTSNLVNEAKNAGVKYIVKQSVLGADAEPSITPGRLHRQAEKIIEESGIPFTFLRPNFFMQNFITFYSNFIKTQGAFYVPAGDAKASFVDVRDIAAVAVQALSKSGTANHIRKAYDITGGEAISYGQAAEILSKEIGKKVNYVNISDEDARKGMKDMGADEWTINSMIELFGITRAGYLSEISAAVEQVTGNKPIPFSQFARDYAGAFK
ncbi:MAG TPA: SDR family oxidoreductase [Nitrososphaeraceae archaeon]|nr:SDR family oxidoreductase [Nitrososphaeraceae archaeon]